MSAEDFVAQYRYGASIRQLALPVLFFSVCTVVLVLRALDEGGTAWLLAAASAAFVIIPLVLTLVAKLQDRKLVLHEGGLSVPGKLGGKPTDIALSDIRDAFIHDVSGQRFLVINHSGPQVYIAKSAFPDANEFLEVVSFVTSGEIDGLEDLSLPRASTGAGRALLLKVTAIFTFCGGPLYVSDLLQPKLGDPYGFIVAFAPVAVLVFAALTVLDDEPTRWTRALAISGLASALVIVVEGLYACAQILGGEARQDSGLIVGGTVVGIIAAALYTRIAKPHFTAN